MGNIQRVLQIRMRNSNLIQKAQDRVKDQNDQNEPQKQETTNMTSSVHQRNGEQRTNQVMEIKVRVWSQKIEGRMSFHETIQQKTQQLLART